MTEDHDEDYYGGRLMSNHDFDKLFSSGMGMKKSKLYGGVFMKDELENMTPEEGKFYIINLDDVGGSGSHWVLISNIQKTYILYIDPFAVPPPDVCIRFMKRTKKEYRNGEKSKERKVVYYNTISLQHLDSVACGYYVAYFAKELIKKRNVIDIMSDFDLSNDKFAKWYNEVLIQEIKKRRFIGILED